MAWEILIQNSIITEGRIFFNLSEKYLIFNFIVHNCPKNPKNVEIKKIIIELQKRNTELEQKVKDMKIDGETNQKFIEAIDNVYMEENSQLKKKNRELKEKKNKYKSANQELVNLFSFCFNLYRLVKFFLKKNIQIKKITDEYDLLE